MRTLSKKYRIGDDSVTVVFSHGIRTADIFGHPLIGGVKYRRIGSIETWPIHTNPVMLVHKSCEIDTI